MNACEVTAQFAPFVSGSLLSGLNLVVAVLRDSVGYVCVIAALHGILLSVVYIACKVERFVSIILNKDYYYYCLCP